MTISRRQHRRRRSPGIRRLSPCSLSRVRRDGRRHRRRQCGRGPHQGHACGRQGRARSAHRRPAELRAFERHRPGQGDVRRCRCLEEDGLQVDRTQRSDRRDRRHQRHRAPRLGERERDGTARRTSRRSASCRSGRSRARTGGCSRDRPSRSPPDDTGRSRRPTELPPYTSIRVGTPMLQNHTGAQPVAERIFPFDPALIEVIAQSRFPCEPPRVNCP